MVKQIYTRCNNIPYKKRTKVNFFIRMAGGTSNKFNMGLKQFSFHSTFNGVLRTVYMGNVHKITGYTDRKLRFRETNYKFREAAFRSVEMSYRRYLGFYGLKHSEENYINYIKEFINFKIIILDNFFRKYNTLDSIYSVIAKLRTPKFLFCPDINRIVVGSTAPSIYNTDDDFDFDEDDEDFDENDYTYISGNRNSCKLFHKEFKLLKQYIKDKDYQRIEELLLGNSTLSLFWDYQNSVKKLNNLEYLEDYEPILGDEIKKSFAEVVELAIKKL